MISRRYLRVKTMQALYAHSMKPFETVAEGENSLVHTVRRCYDLFLWLFSILPEITYYRANKLEELKGKHHPTPEDLHPNLKFVENEVIAQVENNVTLKKLFATHHINWSEDTDVIVKLFHRIEEMEEYKAYMNTQEVSYEEDKRLVLDIIQHLFGTSEHLRWFFGEKDPNWMDDYEEALSMVYVNIRDFKQKGGDNCKIDPVFKENHEEETFCGELFSKTIVHDAEYASLIESKLQNWELDRVISIDTLMMKMAICEFTEFPEIPIKVTLNEYIDMSKLYSSNKSKIFINGVLDRLIVDLREQGRLNKMGRGLFQN